MTEVKHTHHEGPWKIYVGLGSNYPSIVTEYGDAELGNWVIAERVRWEENAHLIAAAPDMYDALEWVKQACLFADDDGSVGVAEDVVIPTELFNQICAALAKARGEEK